MEPDADRTVRERAEQVLRESLPGKDEDFRRAVDAAHEELGWQRPNEPASGQSADRHIAQLVAGAFWKHAETLHWGRVSASRTH
jgi:hypothetical protein